MKKVTLIEYEGYSKNLLMSKLKLDNETFNKVIKEIKKKNIVKYENKLYKFIFVGICIVGDIVLYIAPKYVENIYNENKILKLLDEYSKRESLNVEEEEFLSFDTDKDKNNLLGIIKYILDDYFKNGLYLKKQNNITLNGTGKVDWNKTIEENKVLFDDKNNPIYFELQTLKNDIDYDAIITKIHKLIVNKCFFLLSKFELQDIFEYDFENFYLLENYDTEFMIFSINKELSGQFENRKVNLLKFMLMFLEGEDSNNNEDYNITLYGTKYFYVVWEKINSYLFKNQYEKLIKNIPNVCWKVDSGKWIDNSKNRIVPDILRIYKNNLIIIDAKYYNIKLNEKLVVGNPGSYDIIKQYTYEMAFEKNKKILEVDNIFNILLYPKCINASYLFLGFVKLDIFNFKPIANIYLSDEFVYDRYINNNPFTKNELKQFIIYLKSIYEDYIELLNRKKCEISAKNNLK